MAIVEMDQGLAWKLIEGYQNELDPEVKKLEAYYRQFDCPRCKGSCRKEIDARHTFADPNTLVPRALLRCISCQCLFNPHILGDQGPMILEMGNPAKIPSPIHIFGTDDR